MCDLHSLSKCLMRCKGPIELTGQERSRCQSNDLSYADADSWLLGQEDCILDCIRHCRGRSFMSMRFTSLVTLDRNLKPNRRVHRPGVCLAETSSRACLPRSFHIHDLTKNMAASDHSELISVLTELYVILDTLAAAPDDSLRLPPSDTDIHTDFNADAAREGGFSDEAVEVRYRKNVAIAWCETRLTSPSADPISYSVHRDWCLH